MASPDGGRERGRVAGRRMRGRQRCGPSVNRDDRNFKLFAGIAVATCLVITIGYGAAAAVPGTGGRAGLAAGLAGLAAIAVGGFLGFLFGIPKIVTTEPNNVVPAAGAKSSKERSWQANTNLEQISDWLTKILLGIGLTQIMALPIAVQETGEYIADSIGPGASPMVGSTVLILFTVAGFVIGNLVTRFDLCKAIDREDVLERLTTAVIAAPNDCRAVEALCITSLYAPPPEGFEQAIKAGESDQSLLAAAYAQQFVYERDRGGSSVELEEIRHEALAHMAAGIEKNPQMKAYFQQLANPLVGSGEDDLEVFKDDPDFSEKWT